MAAVLPTSAEMISPTQTNAQQKVDIAALVDFAGENTNKGTTAGTTTAYTLALVPALTALEAGQRFRVKFNAANTTATPTLNVNGLGAVALKVYDAAGAKQNPAVGALALNMLTDVEYDGTDYVVITPAPGRRVAQVVNTTTGAVATGTTQIPADDSIPQQTEGDEYMTRSITPTNASSTLEVTVEFSGSTTILNYVTVALFRDATASALAAKAMAPGAATLGSLVFTVQVAAGSTSATTFKVRAGQSSASGTQTVTFNGASAARLFGGVIPSSITIKEILP